MKNIFKLLILCLVFTSCEETESLLFEGTTGVGFNENVVEVNIPNGGITKTVGITSTTLSSVDRTFEAVVVPLTEDDESLPLQSSDYSLGTVVIPANSYTGTFDVTFNYDGLTDFTDYKLQVALVVPEGGSAFPPVTFEILREYDITTFACTDLRVSIIVDTYGSETSFNITDSSGTIVAEGGPYEDILGTQYVQNVSLAAGCYTFTLFDSYGDGQFDGTNDGTYSVVCIAQPIVTYVSGSGGFDAFEVSSDFCVVE